MIHKGYTLSIPTSANQRLSVPNKLHSNERINAINHNGIHFYPH